MTSPTNEERIDELMKMLKHESGKMNWKVVVDIVKEELKPYQIQGFAPSLRTMFYRLYSKGVLPNTEYHYNQLSKVTADARMDRRLPIDCFSDSSRNMIADFTEVYKTIDDFMDRDYLKKIKELPEKYPELIPRWHRQPEYIEVWIEKDAMLGTFESILEGRDVRIVSNKGFDSLSWLLKNVKRLSMWSRKWVDSSILLDDPTTSNYRPALKNIHVLYFGDFDPSGEDMDRDLENRIDLLREYKHTGISFDEIDFQRIAVTKDQIREYNLPIDIDAETQEKLDRDSRTPGFIEKYGELYAVELDALPAIVPDEFRELVIGSVDKHFDEDIHEENTADYSEDDTKKLIKKYLKQFLKEF